jgi:sarcosine oxidase delta subunit
MFDRLPRDTLASWLDEVRCPWCGGDMDDAPLTLGAIHHLHTFSDRGLRWGERQTDGQAGECQAAVTCPTCGKPSIAAFPIMHREPATRLMAVRTAADVAWASHVVARVADT